jgi:hypothetical protein
MSGTTHVKIGDWSGTYAGTLEEWIIRQDPFLQHGRVELKRAGELAWLNSGRAPDFDYPWVFSFDAWREP